MKISKTEKQKIYNDYIEKLEHKRDAPYEILNDFGISQEQLDNCNLNFVYNKELGLSISIENSLRIKVSREDNDIRNQTEFEAILFDGDLRLLQLFYSLDIVTRIIKCKRIVFENREYKGTSMNDLKIIVLSFLKRMYSGRHSIPPKKRI